MPYNKGKRKKSKFFSMHRCTIDPILGDDGFMFDNAKEKEKKADYGGEEDEKSTIDMFFNVYSRVAKIVPNLILHVGTDIQIAYDREYEQFVFKKVCESGCIYDFQEFVKCFSLGDVCLDSFTFSLM